MFVCLVHSIIGVGAGCGHRSGGMDVAVAIVGQAADIELSNLGMASGELAVCLDSELGMRFPLGPTTSCYDSFEDTDRLTCFG